VVKLNGKIFEQYSKKGNADIVFSCIDIPVESENQVLGDGPSIGQEG
jgi:hypothetical protein